MGGVNHRETRRDLGGNLGSMQSTRGALTTAADPPRDGFSPRPKHARASQSLSLSWTHHRPLLPPV